MDRSLDEIPGLREWRIAVEREAKSGGIRGGKLFSEFRCGVASSTAVDALGDQVSAGLLEKTAADVNASGILLTVNHDPLVQPVGKIFAARVFFDEPTGIHLLVTVMGLYEAKAMPVVGATSPSLKAYEAAPGMVQLELDDRQFPDDFVSDLISGSPEIVSRQTALVVRKAFEPILVLTVAVPFVVFFLKSFAEAAGSKLGDKTADEILALYAWLKRKVALRFSSLPSDAKRLVLKSRYKNCQVAFVLPTGSRDVLDQAIDRLGDGASLVSGFVDEMVAVRPESVVLAWDEKQGTWSLLHAFGSDFGVLSKAPVAVEWEQLSGLSIEARILEARRQKGRPPDE